MSILTFSNSSQKQLWFPWKQFFSFRKFFQVFETVKQGQLFDWPWTLASVRSASSLRSASRSRPSPSVRRLSALSFSLLVSSEVNLVFCLQCQVHKVLQVRSSVRFWLLILLNGLDGGLLWPRPLRHLGSEGARPLRRGLSAPRKLNKPGNLTTNNSIKNLKKIKTLVFYECIACQMNVVPCHFLQ